jgi:dTDP-glucose 4,6-dehydratase|tara:strand:- start:651 stop:1691 length:1041 start_codon:yes stop_codon:yes gene_type:complete
MKNNKYFNFNKSLDQDFENIYISTRYLWKNFKRKKIFITGGTGFFGYWLIRSFIYANEKLKLNSKIYVLTRKKNIKKSLIYKLCANRNVFFHVGDIRNFKKIEKKFDYIIHGATTSARETFKEQSPKEKIDIIVNGTKYILDHAVRNKSRNFLYISSGSVYGNNNNLDLNILGQSKLIAEGLVSNYSKKSLLNTKTARCFSFVGPLIPLDIHYAIGNFLKRSVMKQSIVLNSNGKSLRSYMYMSDLTIWLWTMLFKGKNNQIYNLGSDKPISILNLAKLINKLTINNKKIKFKKNKENFINNYIPSVSKTKKTLGLKIRIPLNQAIQKTFVNINKNKSIYRELENN